VLYRQKGLGIRFCIAENRTLALEAFVTCIRKVVEETIDNILNSEIDLFLGKSEESSNKRNGYKERDYNFKGLGTIRIKMLVDRKRRFNSVVIQ
jgi:transposase-like protein